MVIVWGRSHVIGDLVWSIDPLNYKSEGTHGNWSIVDLLFSSQKMNKDSDLDDFLNLLISIRATSRKNVNPKFKVTQGHFKVRVNEN